MDYKPNNKLKRRAVRTEGQVPGIKLKRVQVDNPTYSNMPR